VSQGCELRKGQNSGLMVGSGLMSYGSLRLISTARAGREEGRERKGLWGGKGGRRGRERG
jgi:hypothetical protein